jgi:hypothetical protein
MAKNKHITGLKRLEFADGIDLLGELCIRRIADSGIRLKPSLLG